MIFFSFLMLSVQIAKASTSLTIQCAPIGRYDVVVSASEPCVCELKAFLRHPNDDWPLMKLIESSKLNYQNRIKRRVMVIKWNKRCVLACCLCSTFVDVFPKF